MLSPRRALVAVVLVAGVAAQAVGAEPTATSSAKRQVWNGDVRGGVISFAKRGRQITFFGMTRDFGKCTSPPAREAQGYPDVGRVRNGRFYGRHEDSRKIFEVGGRLLGGGRARGFFRSKLKRDCDTGRLPWTARLGPVLKPGKWTGKVRTEKRRYKFGWTAAKDGNRMKRLRMTVVSECPKIGVLDAKTSVGVNEYLDVLISMDGTFELKRDGERIAGRIDGRTATGTYSRPRSRGNPCTGQRATWRATYRG
jgi:hypothetical protein